IYWVDVEGGAATLIIAPSGQSLLVDSGWRKPDDRDAKRIYAVATGQAHLKKIDYFEITHYHADHLGGIEALAKMIPISHFVDHGARVETSGGVNAQNWAAYQVLATGGKRIIVKPGDRIPLKGVTITIVSSNGDLIAQPINGGGPNDALCQDAKRREPLRTEDPRSVGFLLSYGKFQFADLGDLPWDQEDALACPVNRLGKVDLLQVTCHGMSASGAPQQLWALQPAVAVINNGPRKGGTAVVFETVKQIPGLQDIWQVHRALASDDAHNTSEPQTANLEPEAECHGNWLKAEVKPSGEFTLTNSRNGLSKAYQSR
ncbi:MAG TPA: MBL fold metallo-hydrolase, partial [Bryobacterales bacterium]|nr:MBL fold metallo-hydrolase [Bryobacterales bacterium]